MKLKPKDRRKQREESIHKSRLNSLRESRENGNSIYHPNSLPVESVYYYDRHDPLYD